jgi:hypothetical protein
MDIQSEEDDKRVEHVTRAFKGMEKVRTNFESHWNDVAHFVWPEMRNTFKPGQGMNELQGVKKTDRQLDSTPQLALNTFGSILDSLNTPRNQTWHSIGADDKELNDQRDVRLWFEEVNRVLFKERYAPGANFASQNQMHYKNLGAFGTGVMFVDGQTDGRGLRYKSIGIGEAFIRENHQGVVDELLRYFTLEGHQVIKKFTKEELGEDLFNSAEDKPDTRFAFMQYVRQNSQLDPTRLDRAGKPFSSTTINVDRKRLVREGGYNTFPFIVSRYEQAPEETYGRGPAFMALPAIRTLNSQKSTVLKQGHRSADPVLLTHDDGLLDGLDITPGAMNPGGVDENGRLMVQTLPVGNFQIGKDMMDQERETINAAFLVHLFQILTDTPRMTATEVIERTREKGILLAPTVGRQQSEYLGPLIDREIDVLVDQGMIPPMPQALLDAKGEYTVTYNSPLSRAMRAEEAAGVIRVVENILPIIQTTGDPSPLDNFDLDVITRELSDIQAVPEHWMKSMDAVAEIREERAQQQERAQQAEEASGQAQLMQAANAQG